MTAWVCYELTQVQHARGRLDAVARTCLQVLEMTVPPAAGPAYAGLAEVAYQRDALGHALRRVTEGIELCRRFVYAPPLASGLARWRGSGRPTVIRSARGTRWKRPPGPGRARSDWSTPSRPGGRGCC